MYHSKAGEGLRSAGGKEGLYLTVFDDKQQAALSEKYIKVKDYRDTYTMGYCKNTV
jgi:hypothetical protein